MQLNGEEGLQSLEIGKIHKGVYRLINSVWTTEFIPTRDGIFIVKYSRSDKEGYEKEKELPQVQMIEDDDRTVTKVQISDPKPASFSNDENIDNFTVINQKHVFDYEKDPTPEDLKHPDLQAHRSRWVAKKYNLGESNMKHLLLFETFIKKYGEKISHEEFKNLKKGSQVMYMGAPHEVLEPGEYNVKLKNLRYENEVNVNYNMFNQKGAIVKKD